MSSFRFEMHDLNSDGARTHQILNTTKQKKKNVQTPRKEKKPLKTEINHVELNFGCFILPNSLTLTLPIRTVSEANCTEPWQKRHKRHKAQKKAIFSAIVEHKHLLRLPCCITYIRYAPKQLDRHDNLPMSMKYLNDQLCAEITSDFRPGRADDTDQITIKYDQIKSKNYGVKIIIEF